MKNLLTNNEQNKNKNNENNQTAKKIYNLRAEKLLRAANDSFIYFKDYEMAMTQVQEVLNLDPANTKAYILKGTIFFCLDELPTALECFEKALLIDPKSVEAHSLKANVLDITGNLKDALVSCDKAFINVNEKNQELLTSLFDQKIAILIKSKKYRQAKETLKQCYTCLREDDSLYLASCYRELIDSLNKKREKKRELVSQRLKLIVHSS